MPSHTLAMVPSHSIWSSGQGLGPVLDPEVEVEPLVVSVEVEPLVVSVEVMGAVVAVEVVSPLLLLLLLVRLSVVAESVPEPLAEVSVVPGPPPVVGVTVVLTEVDGGAVV